MARQPKVTWTALPAADGSAQYDHEGFSILTAVNGPLEVQRRDEIPNEAFLEVNVREARGSGGPRERLLETQLAAALRPLILVSRYPRTLIQMTLQVLRTPNHAVSAAPTPQASSPLPLLAPCFNSAVCALLDSGLAMAGVAMACTLSESPNGGDDQNTSHAFAYDGNGSLLLAESEGPSTVSAWRSAAKGARDICVGTDATPGLMAWLRQAAASDYAAKNRWRADSAQS